MDGTEGEGDNVLKADSLLSRGSISEIRTKKFPYVTAPPSVKDPIQVKRNAYQTQH